MSNLLQLQSGLKSFGTKMLFQSADFAINEEEHVGVIGPNGAGKTTLFRILTGQDTLDGGNLVRSKSLRLGYLAQTDHWGPHETIEDYLTKDCKTPLWELKALGNRLGLTEELFSRPILSLSGGYRMRSKLLYLIGQEPNLMLLDEPTNYLDLETTLVLEEFLQGYKGAFLLISHDREFLRRTTDHVLEIEGGDIIKYNGNLDDYFEQKEMLRSQLEKRAMSLQEKKNEILKFVARFGAKATKARQAQSKLKSLDKMETIELKALPITASIRIPAPMKASKVVADFDNADLGYVQKTVLQGVTMKILSGDHVAVVGLNGAGKSTFLKVLARALLPLRGKFETGMGTAIGYFAQHVAENLDPSKTVIEEMMSRAHPTVSRQDGLNMAGSLLFSGEEIQKKISVLSGGEKSRVALGQIFLQKANCLVLDEPTNHLDFQTMEALTQALMKYEGTIVVVSHDRSFIRRVGTKILEINHGQLSVYHGTYEEYVWSLQKGVLALRTDVVENREARAEAVPVERPPGFNYKETKKNLDRQLKQCERRLSEIDKELATFHEKLITLNAEISRGEGALLVNKTKELVDLQLLIDNLEGEWLTNSEKRDELKNSLASLTG